jgi:hypothetical protein
MDDGVAQAARTAARQLAPELGDQLLGDVEAVLHAGDDAPALERYLDPISLAGLIVSVASLAWTVSQDLKAKTNATARAVVERRVRVKVRETDATATPQQQSRIIEVVVTEVMSSIEPSRKPW